MVIQNIMAEKEVEQYRKKSKLKFVLDSLEGGKDLNVLIKEGYQKEVNFLIKEEIIKIH